MRFLAWILALSLTCLPRAFAQVLPDLGDVSSSDLPPATERKVGEEIMRDIRMHEPAYLDDPEVAEYLNSLGGRLVAASPGARQDFEFFAIRDTSINAFALPGGFVGVHTGLITASMISSTVAPAPVPRLSFSRPPPASSHSRASK